MQILIKAESIEELSQVLESIKVTPAKAEQNTAKAEKNAAKAEQKEAKAEQKAEETSALVMPAPAQDPAAAAVPAAPATVKTVTKQEVQAKAIAQMDAGKQAELQALLKKYGVPALPSVPDDQLAAFYADLEVL